MVSVIVPYYNRPEKLKRCINSVLKQTHQDFEILVIDDYSIIPLKLDIDPRIKVYRNSENSGPGLSRNVGLQKAKGNYIAFLDSDDYWDSRFLKRCMQRFFGKTDIAMVFANGYEVNEREEIIGIRRNSIIILNSILPQILKEVRHWGTGGCLWRSEYLKNIEWLSTSPWEDYAFDVGVAINCNKISGIKDCLVYYDLTGKDKISRQYWETAVSGKNKSLLHISKALRNSYFRNHLEIKEAITIQLINNIIAITGSKRNDKPSIGPSINEVKEWNGIIMWLYLKLIGYFPAKSRLKLFRLFKRLIA